MSSAGKTLFFMYLEAVCGDTPISLANFFCAHLRGDRARDGRKKEFFSFRASTDYRNNHSGNNSGKKAGEQGV